MFGPINKKPTLLTPVGILILGVLYALLWFGSLDYRHLIPSDEGRYAEIAREMLVTGDWITPRDHPLCWLYQHSARRPTRWLDCSNCLGRKPHVDYQWSCELLRHGFISILSLCLMRTTAGSTQQNSRQHSQLDVALLGFDGASNAI